ncbi:hypothetical protein KPH14_007617 [Odynerus spinipes]|uniref:HTH CENPB-type domain-containing protein n=1 Tax=Odynerus spinipes TaxID=1348599 RepID=A0AAD9RHQ8_9HYME|nr:hypothetical protein KPH14_007617 [Odynerus spinipes]
MFSEKSLKRKRIVLNLSEKCDILKRLKNGESGAALAKEYNVGKSTISGIKLNEDKILQYNANILSASQKKVMSTAENYHLENAIFLWFLQQRAIGTPISGPIICEKALQLHEKMGGNTNFKASNGWLKNFKARHGIRFFLNDKEIIQEVVKHDITSNELEETEEAEKAEVEEAEDVKKAKVEEPEIEENAEVEEMEEAEPIPSNIDALVAIKTVIKWFKAKLKSNTDDLHHLIRLKELVNSEISNKNE